ncbi:MAG: hypothetical protein PHY54_11555 [Methylococcales bacterium]|nr:hypothetical protein [Methylococcales bacterium]
MTTNPASLTRNDLSHFRQLITHGLLAQAYDELAERGYRYAALANGVVRGDTFSGRIALEFLEKTAEDQESPLSAEAVDAIRMALANVYLDTLSLQFSSASTLVTRDILADEAWTFHSAAFQNQGLGPDAWTLNQPFKLMDAEARQDYWTSVLNSAGNFAKEVLLGLMTDFIMKEAALDPLAPIPPEDALSWLHRLHNLDTYLAAVEITSSQLDRQAYALPATLSGKMQNGLNAPSIKLILDYVDQASRDEPLKTQLSVLGRRIINSRIISG